MLTLVAAVNLMFWNTLASSPAAWRYTWHFVDSALPFAAYEAGRRIRIKRFEMECRPLVDRLAGMLAALEERSE